MAVASNFHHTLSAIIDEFEKTHEHHVTLVPGSTGKHYAQIVNGAPFDIFFAADEKRPRLLEENDLVVTNTRFTYAFGKLVLWRPSPDYGEATEAMLESLFQHLAIANPKLAPYGRASEQVLRHLDFWDKHVSQLVRGENIAQAFQLVNSGNADLGFIAYSQLLTLAPKDRGLYWVIPSTTYDPIRQQGVLLRESEAGRQLIDFMHSPKTHQLIVEKGYILPNAF